jgi:hypothetical protein
VAADLLAGGGAHPLLRFLLDAAAGRFPPVDGEVTVVPGLARGQRAVLSFTGHAVVATDRDPRETRNRAGDGFGGAFAPAFVLWLAAGGQIGVIDNTLVAHGTGTGSPLVPRTDLEHHHRVRHARHVRDDVRVFGDDRGLVTLSVGLAGRTEVGVEALQEGQGRGWGSSLITDALGLVPAGEPVFAAVSPGNARSLRAFLRLGFVPVGAEIIITNHG